MGKNTRYISIYVSIAAKKAIWNSVLRCQKPNFSALKCVTLDKKEPHFSSDYPQFGPWKYNHLNSIVPSNSIHIISNYIIVSFFSAGVNLTHHGTPRVNVRTHPNQPIWIGNCLDYRRFQLKKCFYLFTNTPPLFCWQKSLDGPSPELLFCIGYIRSNILCEKIWKSGTGKVSGTGWTLPWI